MRVSVLAACMHATCVKCPLRLEEGVGCLGTGVTHGFVPHVGAAEQTQILCESIKCW